MKRFAVCSTILSFAALAASAGSWYINLSRSGWPSFATVNQPFSLDFSIENTGSEPIKSLDIKYSPYGGTAMTVHSQLSEPIEAGASQTFTVDGFVSDVTGKEVFGTLTLTGVNGEQNSGKDAYGYIVCGNRYIKRNLVIEEATGTECGYCPIGIVGMEYMRNTYSDGSWIGISVFDDSDMDTADSVYAKWYKRVGSTPKAIANRDFSSNYYPAKQMLEELYLRTLNDAAVVGILADVNADAAAKTAKLDVKTFYAFDETEADYKIAYTITEDNLGPYVQINNYAGTSNDVDGWENMSYRVKWIFSDVAREGSVYEGIEGSVPAEVKSADYYGFSCDVDLSHINDINYAYLNIMVLNSQGQIENAVRRKLDGTQNDKLSTASALAVKPSADSHIIAIYDLQGRQVNPNTIRPGIYIARLADGTTRKIIR
jgi:hypothetical protein